MSETDMKNIVENQVDMMLKEKGMRKAELSDKEYLQWCYDMAIKMLIEL